MPDESPSINLVAALLCDDVRKEENGKYILVGVYPEGVGVPEFPVDIRFGLFILFTVGGLGPLRMELEVRGSDEKPLGRYAFGIQVTGTTERQQIHSIGLPVVGLKIPGPGILSVYYRANEGEWQSLQSFPVVQQPAIVLPIAPTSSPPPS